MSTTGTRICRPTALSAPLMAALWGLVLVVACTDGTAPTAPRPACGALAGTYVTTFTDKEEVFSSRGLMTFTSDGILVVSDSAQGGVPGVWDPFSTAQGTWKCVSEEAGKLVIRAVGLNFVLPSDGSPPSFGRVDYEAGLDTGTGALSGTAILRFASGEDLESAAPVEDPGELVDAFDFEGKRVVIPAKE